MTKVRNHPVRSAPARSRGPTPLYVLSDSTGNLARHMVTSFLTQFPAGSFEVVTRPFVGEPDRIVDSLDAVAARPGIVFQAVEETAARIVDMLRLPEPSNHSTAQELS